MGMFAQKHTARELAERAEVPVLSGSPLLVSAEDALECARTVGLPILLKATGGWRSRGAGLLQRAHAECVVPAAAAREQGCGRPAPRRPRHLCHAPSRLLPPVPPAERLALCLFPFARGSDGIRPPHPAACFMRPPPPPAPLLSLVQAAAAASASTSVAPRRRWQTTLHPHLAKAPLPLATPACLWRSTCRQVRGTKATGQPAEWQDAQLGYQR